MLITYQKVIFQAFNFLSPQEGPPINSIPITLFFEVKFKRISPLPSEKRNEGQSSIRNVKMQFKELMYILHVRMSSPKSSNLQRYLLRNTLQCKDIYYVIGLNVYFTPLLNKVGN